MKAFQSLAWGSSIALSWLWGLGLYFSVQFAFQFGLVGLLAFAIPNALGLWLFGWLTGRSAEHQSGRQMEESFMERSKPLGLLFLFYQVITIALCLFAIARYFFAAMNVNPQIVLVLAGTLGILLIAILQGRAAGISRIKFLHLAYFLLAVIAVGLLWPIVDASTEASAEGHLSNSGMLGGYILPILLGFLVGPWLDLQQWQRAIQIKKEGGSIQAAYAIGAVCFLGFILFHGALALAVAGDDMAQYHIGIDGQAYAHSSVLTYIQAHTPALLWAYALFICASILTTLDSAYLATKWFQQRWLARGEHVLLSILPNGILESTLPLFGISAALALGGHFMDFELIYFVVFYGSFFIAYGIVFMRAVLRGERADVGGLLLPSALGLLLAAMGYFFMLPMLLGAGAVLPLGFAWRKKGINTDTEVDSTLETVSNSTAEAKPEYSPASGLGAKAVSEGDGDYMEGQWYVHPYTPSYADTNSVGNIYFAQYAMWVGKTRELMFNHFMPNFSLNSTKYYILTKSYQHNFRKEAKEFEKVLIKIRLSDFNRKFATLEHKIFDLEGGVIGFGSQSLLFVDSKTYRQIDIPQEIHMGMIKHLV